MVIQKKSLKEIVTILHNSYCTNKSSSFDISLGIIIDNITPHSWSPDPPTSPQLRNHYPPDFPNCKTTPLPRLRKHISPTPLPPTPTPTPCLQSSWTGNIWNTSQFAIVPAANGHKMSWGWPTRSAAHRPLTTLQIARSHTHCLPLQPHSKFNVPKPPLYTASRCITSVQCLALHLHKGW